MRRNLSFCDRRARLGTALALLCLAFAAGAEEPALRYNRDILPILSDHCFRCHGPDKNQRKGDLRLDVEAEAHASGVFATASDTVAPILARITSSDPDEVMPPPAALKPLSADQIALLTRWVAAGAAYEPHWSFIPPGEHSPPLPEGHAGWVRTPVDAFVLARLEKEGIAPAREADRETLLRRITLTLTGLPPTLDAMNAFLADSAPDAYERVVDRLLDSPAYGERMALAWLDAARYADSYGFQADRMNHLWPWREWVIRAFNDNLPFDAFLTWQLAGDLLPDATQDQRLATAFNRLHRMTNEGGSILEEWRLEYVADRVNTFGTAVLGLAMECARCHDHKFDPISQREYYQLSAFFSNINESGMYPHFTDAIPTPALTLYADGQREEHERLKAAVARAELEAQEAAQRAEAGYTEWLANPNRAVPLPRPLLHLPLDEVKEGRTPETVSSLKAVLQGEPKPVSGKHGQALQFSGDNSVEVDGGKEKQLEAGAFSRTQPFSVAAWVRMAAPTQQAVLLHYSKAREDAGSRGWCLALEEGKPLFSLVHFWPGDAVEVRSEATLTPEVWTHLTVTYDGSGRAAGVRIFLDGRATETRILRDHLVRDTLYEDNVPAGLMLAARFRDSGFKDGALDEVMLFDHALSSLEVASVAGVSELATAIAAAAQADASEVLREQALEFYRGSIDPGCAEARARTRAARDAERDFIGATRAIMTMEEMPVAREVHVLKRGDYKMPGERVFPDTPQALLPFPADAPRNRLGLAQWLVQPDHPLTARVAVNRIWKLFFGRGLVETQEDFGVQGRPPSHPELLDWLARRFVQSGWDMKAMCRLIATSAVYRQSSQATPSLEERDPDNILLARGPRYRLEAEFIRDRALAASGLLNPQLGGPSVKPYHPEGLWEDVGWEKYVQDHGPALYRRSMYTYWKRTVPPPAMLSFDAVSRETCVVRRETTQTPLQALVLLNETGFVEAARVLAARLLKQNASMEACLEEAFRRLLGRHADAEELRILLGMYQKQHDYFANQAGAARDYLKTGEAPAEDGVEAADAAALTAVVQAIMNLDGFQVNS